MPCWAAPGRGRGLPLGIPGQVHQPWLPAHVPLGGSPWPSAERSRNSVGAQPSEPHCCCSDPGQSPFILWFWNWPCVVRVRVVVISHRVSTVVSQKPACLLAWPQPPSLCLLLGRGLVAASADGGSWVWCSPRNPRQRHEVLEVDTASQGLLGFYVLI